MVLVYFRGRGDWFIKTIDGVNSITDREASWYEAGHTVNGARRPSLLLEHRYCSEYSGVFKLTDEDEEELKITKDFEITKKSVKKLLPCKHQNSAFLKIQSKEKISDSDMENCFFLIQRERKDKKEHVPIHYDIKIFESKDTAFEKKIDPRSEQSYLLIIGALLEYISGENKEKVKHPLFENEKGLIEYLDKMYGEYRGISKRTLEAKFPKAREALKEKLR